MIETFANVWDAIEESPEEATKMTMISDLMMEVTRIIRQNRWTDKEAAARLHTETVRVKALLAGKIELFEVEDLVSMAAALGRKIRVEIEAA